MMAFSEVAAKEIELPDSIEVIDMFAFFNSKLTSVRSAIIGSIGDYIFKKCKKLKRINVPAGAMNAYKRMLLTYLHKKLVEF